MANIELPDLESQTDVEIVSENLHAVQAIYFAYQLEEMRLFQVVERIVELFQQDSCRSAAEVRDSGWSRCGPRIGRSPRACASVSTGS